MYKCKMAKNENTSLIACICGSAIRSDRSRFLKTMLFAARVLMQLMHHFTNITDAHVH